MPKRALALSQAYRLLEPGPAVLVSTAMDGHRNIMPMSWYTMMEFEPPLVGCVVSGRNHTFDVLQATGECVINIPTVELAQQVVRCGNSTGTRVDKFDAFGLTAVPASRVQAPLIAECFASLECKVVNSRLVPAYNFFVLEVVKAWLDRSKEPPRTIHHRGRGVFMVAGEVITLPSKKK